MKLATLSLLGLASPANGMESRNHFFNGLKGSNDRSNPNQPVEPISVNEIEQESWPYLVSIGSDHWGHFCGGSLISQHAVLTSASCMFFAKGLENMWDPPQWVDIHRRSLEDDYGYVRVHLQQVGQCAENGDIVYHKDFDFTKDQNDVAVIFLTESADVGDVVPVVLNRDCDSPSEDGEPLGVVGWGYATVSHSVNVAYVTNANCTDEPYKYPYEVIHDDMICAIEEGNEAWSGNAGDPLVLRNPEGGEQIQVGIASWTWDTADDKNYPNVYTRISSVERWIRKTVCRRVNELCEDRTEEQKARVPNNGVCNMLPIYDPSMHDPLVTPSPSMTPTEDGLF